MHVKISLHVTRVDEYAVIIKDYEFIKLQNNSSVLCSLPPLDRNLLEFVHLLGRLVYQSGKSCSLVHKHT